LGNKAKSNSVPKKGKYFGQLLSFQVFELFGKPAVLIASVKKWYYAFGINATTNPVAFSA